MAENNISMKGVLYEIYKRDWVGKKDPSKSGTNYSYILEVPTFRLVRFQDKDTEEWKEQAKTQVELVKIELPYKMNPDDFRVGAEVAVDFYIEGKEWNPSDGRGKMFFNENKLTSIKLIKESPIERKASMTYMPPTVVDDDFPAKEPIKEEFDDDLPF